MDRDIWKSVNEIFHAALEVPSSDRRAFVAVASGDDAVLRSEVNALLEADAQAGNYLEEPLIPPNLLSATGNQVVAGDILCERFRILRKVGEGGMGQVFQAFDIELSVSVAIKVVRSEIASSVDALSRFRQEVRLARRVTHPNICRTFDLEREVSKTDPADENSLDIVFITMEFLEGETLANRIKRTGALPAEDAIEIARQIADALNSAHQLGVIHRDMKPANIMLVPTEDAAQPVRAVITDFGLARVDPSDSPSHATISSSQFRPIGTLAYMAPEQLQGCPVSSATDIFSFGLVLYEMITGERVFSSANFLEGIAQRVGAGASLPLPLPRDVPDQWARAINGCLKKSPGDRYSTALDVLAELTQDGKGKKHVRSTLKWNRFRWAVFPGRARSVLWGGLFAILLAPIGLGFRYYKVYGGQPVAPGSLVYVTPVRNLSGNSAYDCVTSLLQSGLSQSPQINLLDIIRVEDTLQHMGRGPNSPIDEPIAREVAMRTGAARVVFSTLTESHGEFSLNVEIQQTDNNPGRFRHRWTENFQWKVGSTQPDRAIPPEFLEATRSAGDWIRRNAGESASDIARLNLPPEDATTRNWEALVAYGSALEALDKHDRMSAVSDLKTAIAKDPHFALAYGKLGDVLVNLGMIEQGYHAYLRALDESDRDRLPIRERDRIRGIYAQDTGDYLASEDALREYCRYYEHDYLGWFYRGTSLSMLGRNSEATEVLRRAHDISPDRINVVIMLLRQSLLVGDLKLARIWIDDLRSLKSADGVSRGEGTVAFLQGDYDTAIRSFQSIAKSENPVFHFQGLAFLADLYTERGQYRDALDQIGLAIRERPDDASFLLQRATIYGQMGEVENQLADLRRAVEMDKSPMTILAASDVLGRQIAAGTGAETGPVKNVLKELNQELPSEDFGTISKITKFRVRGEILLAAGNFNAALHEFRKADGLDAPMADRSYMGRALMVAAANSRDASLANSMRREAQSCFSTIALNPAVVWQFPMAFSPGAYANHLQSWLRLSQMLGEQDGPYRTSLAAFHRLRTDAQADNEVAAKFPH